MTDDHRAQTMRDRPSLDEASYLDRDLYLRDCFAGGIDLVDYDGRDRVGMGGSGHWATRIRACTPARQPATPKVTTKLTLRQFWTGYEAVAFANLNEVAFNTFLTVSWGSVGANGRSAWLAHQRFMSLLRSRLTDWGEEPVWIWVRERGPVLGDHSHILLSLNPFRTLDLEHWANRAVQTVTGAVARSPSKQPGDGVQTVHVSTKCSHDTVGQWAWFRYMFKGMDPNDTAFVLEGRHGRMLVSDFTRCQTSRQGTVEGKRSGVSECLGPEAIARYDETEGLPYFWPRSQRRDRQPIYNDDFLRQAALRKPLVSLALDF